MEYQDINNWRVLWLITYGVLMLISISIVLWAEAMKKPLAPYLTLSGSIFFLTAISSVFIKWMGII